MKLTKDKALQAICETAKRYVLYKAPKNEYELIKEMEKFFTGISLKQSPDGYFLAAGEIIETEDGLTGKIGEIEFPVTTCTEAYTRDDKGYILNMDEFKNTTV